MAVFDDMEKKDKLLLYPHSIEWKHHIPVANRAEAQPVEVTGEEPLRAECLHFLQCHPIPLPAQNGWRGGPTRLDGARTMSASA